MCLELTSKARIALRICKLYRFCLDRQFLESSGNHTCTIMFTLERPLLPFPGTIAIRFPVEKC
jgi:hypothetical protein